MIISRKKSGNVTDVATLDFRDFWGARQDRIRWRNGQDEIAVMAIDRIMERHNLNEKKCKEIREKIFKKEVEETKAIRQQTRMGFTRKPFEPLEKRKPDFRKNLR